MAESFEIRIARFEQAPLFGQSPVEAFRQASVLELELAAVFVCQSTT